MSVSNLGLPEHKGQLTTLSSLIEYLNGSLLNTNLKSDYVERQKVGKIGEERDKEKENDQVCMHSYLYQSGISQLPIFRNVPLTITACPATA